MTDADALHKQVEGEVESEFNAAHPNASAWGFMKWYAEQAAFYRRKLVDERVEKLTRKGSTL